jgi:hypothetical protein
VNRAVALHSESSAVRRQRHVAVAGGLLLGSGALALGSESWRLGALLVIGALLGVSLYHAAFGFTVSPGLGSIRSTMKAVTARGV